MVALRAEVDNWRWHGVPFFLRSGKAMGVSRQIIVLGFQPPPMRMFPAHRKDTPYGRQNEIVIDFADPGAIKVYFLTKVPGAQLTLGNAEMAFHYKDSFAASHMLEGYEHLTLMAMVGDPSLFTRSDGIERSFIDWRRIITSSWASRRSKQPSPPPGAPSATKR
jgi:glucose-6-phosphate 1-dehydrogenase